MFCAMEWHRVLHARAGHRRGSLWQPSGADTLHASRCTNCSTHCTFQMALALALARPPCSATAWLKPAFRSPFQYNLQWGMTERVGERC